MKKIMLLLLALSVSYNSLYAQNPKIEKSETFDEPVVGWNKVLQLKNGNTFYFHFTRKHGIEVTVFDKSRKISSTKSLESDLWSAKQLNSSIVEGLYEINGEPVLFLAQFDGRTPTLYRLRLDPFTGDVVKEEEMGTMPKIKFFGGVASDQFYIEKDPQSDCYAVIFFNAFARGADDRIKVVHYDGHHKAINVAYYDSPDESLRYLNYIGAVVDGDKRVYLATYGASSLKGENAHVFISRLNAGDSVFFNKTLDFTEEFRDTKSVMSYNHTDNSIQLLSLSYAKTRGSTGYFVTFMSYIDPESLGLKSVKPLLGEKISDYVHNTLNITKREFQGMPQQMVINPDNSTTVLSEEMIQTKMVNQNGSVVSATTELGAIGISELNADGTERTGFAIMKRQIAAGIYDPLYMTNRRKGKWSALMGYADYNSYMSYDFISTDKGRYIIFNDNNYNFDKDEDDRKRLAVVNTAKLNTICYSLGGNTPVKSFLFGNPDSRQQSSSCFIEASDYARSTGTYATIMIERDGHDRQARMVWLTFE